MNVNIAWGVFALAWAAVCAVCWYVFVFSKARRGKRCTEHADGRVVGASDAHRGEVQLPIVEYKVGDATLRVTGPKFRKTFTTVPLVGVREPRVYVRDQPHLEGGSAAGPVHLHAGR